MEREKCAEHGEIKPLGIPMIQENVNRDVNEQNKKFMKEECFVLRVVLLNQGRSSRRWMIYAFKYPETFKMMKKKTHKIGSNNEKRVLRKSRKQA